MPITANAANRVLNALLNETYVSLHSAYPGPTGANELQGNGYKRQPVRFSPPKDGRRTNVDTIAFPMLPASKVTYVGFWDSESGGRLLWIEPLGYWQETEEEGRQWVDASRDVKRNQTLFAEAGIFGLGITVNG